jgi:hypothetical protein
MTTTEGTDTMQVTLTIDSDTLNDVIGELGRLAGLLEHNADIAERAGIFPKAPAYYRDEAAKVRDLTTTLIGVKRAPGDLIEPTRDPVAHYTAMADEARNESPRCDHCGGEVEPRAFNYRGATSDHWSHKGGKWFCPEGTPTRDGCSSEVAEVGGSQEVHPA